MFCCECQIETAGKFCNQCGSRLLQVVETVPLESVPLESVPIDVPILETIPAVPRELSMVSGMTGVNASGVWTNYFEPSAQRPNGHQITPRFQRAIRVLTLSEQEQKCSAGLFTSLLRRVNPGELLRLKLSSAPLTATP